MNETDPLNHKLLDFAIGVGIAPVSKRLLLSRYLKNADYSLFIRQYFVAGQESK